MNDVNDPRPENSDTPPRRGDREAVRGADRDVPRRGDRDAARRGERAPQDRRRDNSSFGERRGKRYDGSDSPRSSGNDRGSQDRQDTRGTRQGARAGHGGQGGPRRANPGGRPGDDRRGRSGNPGARGGDRPRGDRREGRPGQDARHAARADEPTLPDDIVAADLDPEVRRDLRSLDKSNAETVAKHMVAAMYLVDDDPELALAHGRAAKNRAGRIGVVRETLGVLAYRAGEWAEALSELRAARRISGGPGLLAMMADCERGLERPQRAIELARGDESRMLEEDDLVELRIVEAGARVDMGQLDAALVTLQDAGLDAEARGESAARLDYAYAEVLLAADRRKEAVDWFGHAVAADPEDTTDARARLAELEG